MALLVIGTYRHRLRPVRSRSPSGRGNGGIKRIYGSAIQLPWKPSGIRAGRWTRAMGSAVKSWAARMTRSAAPGAAGAKDRLAGCGVLAEFVGLHGARSQVVFKQRIAERPVGEVAAR